MVLSWFWKKGTVWKNLRVLPPKKMVPAVFLLAVFALGGCQIRGFSKEPISKSDFLLNTFVTITIYDSRDEGLLDESLKLCREYENQLSRTLETSEISRMNNRDPKTKTVAVSHTTAELIQKGLEFSACSHGAFDITIEPVSSLWDFSGASKKVPLKSQLEEAAAKVDYRQVSVEGNQVQFASPDIRIELGAIAKGYIADKIKEYLVGQGVEHALINLGGNVLCIGDKPDGSPFYIGLQMPFQDRNETIAAVAVRDQSVVTSGIYERYFETDGTGYHHILNPNTGFPYENGLLSVTIISPKSVDGDGFSTACFSLGLEEGMALVNRTEDVYGYFITEDYQIHYSEGAEQLLFTP
ncbi:MAG: FAD:protein FMN transferase [Lachnospiraceae bacterium]|jgi:thiamine biosynthesis lipoprotein|nr:FAD:protein FMN transferase [Lachnospiraceae bacterium]